MTGSGNEECLKMEWDDSPNEKGNPMLWLGVWLEGHEGLEGALFHSGRGGGVTTHTVPPEATGLRIRRWPNEGLSPEYVDVTEDFGGEVATKALDFDRPQPYSWLAQFDHGEF